MHVAMVTSLPPESERPRGGVEAAAIALIQALVRLGVRITVVQWGSTQKGASMHPGLGCTVTPLRLRHPALIANWLWTSRDLKKIIEDIAPDVVHMQDVPELGSALRHPRVLTIHGNNPRDEWFLGGRRRFLTVPIMAFTFRHCIRTYDHIILISPYSRRVARFRPQTRLYDVENAIDDRFFEVVREDFSPTVLVIGLLSELKNTLAVVRVAARLRRMVPEVRFHLLGPWRENNPAYRRSVEQFCREQDLGRTVRFFGHVPRETVAAELQEAACLFLPSFQENAPIVIAEAMAVGVPVVASRVGGIPWMVADGKTGLLFDPHRPDEMVQCLSRLLLDRPLCEQMGREARLQASRRFRAEGVAERTLRVYQQVIDDHRP